MKIAIDWKWDVLKNREKFDILGLYYKMWIESWEVIFRK
jgi:hypothetical protein